MCLIEYWFPHGHFVGGSSLRMKEWVCRVCPMHCRVRGVSSLLVLLGSSFLFVKLVVFERVYCVSDCVLVGRPTKERRCEERTSLMISSLLLQQWSSCFVRLISMVLEMGIKWPYNCCYVGCWFQGLFNKLHSILVQLPCLAFALYVLLTSIWYISAIVLRQLLHG